MQKVIPIRFAGESLYYRDGKREAVEGLPLNALLDSLFEHLPCRLQDNRITPKHEGGWHDHLAYFWSFADIAAYLADKPYEFDVARELWRLSIGELTERVYSREDGRLLSGQALADFQNLLMHGGDNRTALNPFTAPSPDQDFATWQRERERIKAPATDWATFQLQHCCLGEFFDIALGYDNLGFDDCRGLREVRPNDGDALTLVEAARRIKRSGATTERDILRMAEAGEFPLYVGVIGDFRVIVGDSRLPDSVNFQGLVLFPEPLLPQLLQLDQINISTLLIRKGLSLGSDQPITVTHSQIRVLARDIEQPVAVSDNQSSTAPRIKKHTQHIASIWRAVESMGLTEIDCRRRGPSKKGTNGTLRDNLSQLCPGMTTDNLKDAWPSFLQEWRNSGKSVLE